MRYGASVMTSSTDAPRAALESLLRWYAEMGVDGAIDETPHDRFAAPVPPPVRREARPSPAARTAPVPAATSLASLPDAAGTSADALIREACARAAAADGIEALHDAFASQPGLGIGAAARMIFAGGVPGARLMLVGAAPDSDDERQGEIFAGPAGRLMDAMLKAIGLDRRGVYLTHVVPWRPPGNRPPTPLELSLCLPFVRRHISLAAPEMILCLGERAAQPLLGSSDPISRLRGRWLTYEGDESTTKLLATFSPAYLLSQPLQKRRAWLDLQMVRDALATSP